MDEHESDDETRGSQHPSGGPIVGADYCPHCRRLAVLDGVCRECDWPG